VSGVLKATIAEHGDSLPEIDEPAPYPQSILIRLSPDLDEQINLAAAKHKFNKSKTMRILLKLSLQDNTPKLAALNLPLSAAEPKRNYPIRVDAALHEELASFRATGISASHLARLAIAAHKDETIGAEWLKDRSKEKKMIQLCLTQTDRDRMKVLSANCSKAPEAVVLRALIRKYLAESRDTYAPLLQHKP